MRIVRRIIRVLGWSMVVLLLLHLSLILLLQTHTVQSYITQEAVDYYESKTGTKAEIEAIKLGWFKTIKVEGLYLEEPNGDTLVYLGSLATSIELMPLLDQQVILSPIYINGFKGHIRQSLPDSQFNFDFITQAFVGEETVHTDTLPVDTNARSVEVQLSKIVLHDIDFQYEDELSKMDVRLRLEEMEVGFDTFSLLNETIHIDQLKLSGTQVSYEQLSEMTQESVETESTTFPFDIGLNDLQLERIGLSLKNIDGSEQEVYIGSLQVRPQKLDLACQDIELESVLLKDSRVDLYLPKNSDTSTTDTVQPGPETLPWDVGWNAKVGRFEMVNCEVQYASIKHSESPFFNPDFVALSYVHTEIEDFGFGREGIKLRLLSASLRERGGTELKKLSAQIELNDALMAARNLHLEVNKSRFHDDVNIQYNSFSQWLEQPLAADLDLKLGDNHIVPADFETFAPDALYSSEWKGWAQLPMQLSGSLQGNGKHMDLSQLKLKAGAHTQLVMDGFLEHLSHTDSLQFNVELNELRTSRSDVFLFAPADVLAPVSPIPDTIKAKAAFEGSLEQIAGSFNLSTTYGAVAGKGSFSNTETPSYKAKIQARKLDLGFFSGNDSLGLTSLDLKAKGRGLDPENMQVEARMLVQQLEVMDYGYAPFQAELGMDQQVASFTTAYEDSNLVFDLQAQYHLADTAVQVDLNLEGADFQHLNLTSEDFRAKFRLHAESRGLDPNTLTAKVLLQDLGLRAEDVEYYSDSLVSGARNVNDQREIYVHSDLLKMRVFGDMDVVHLPEALQAYFNQYFNTDSTVSTKWALKQNFQYSVDFEKNEFISEVLLPGLGPYEPGHIEGRFNGSQHLFECQARIPKLSYDGLLLDTFKMDIISNQDTLKADVALLHGQYDQYELNGFSIHASAANNLLETQLLVGKDPEAPTYSISLNAKSLTEGLQLTLGERHILNSEAWFSSSNNQLLVSNEGLEPHDFKLFHGRQSLELSRPGKEQLALDFNDFDLSTLLNLVEAPTEIASGTLSGNVTLINEKQRQSAFIADLVIPDLALFEKQLGKLELRADNKSKGIFSLLGKVSGFGNDVQIDGTYRPTASTQLLDLNIALHPLQMGTVEALSFEQLQEATGELRGAVSIKGSIDKPEIDGAFNFEETEFVIAYLGSHFKIDQQEIVMDNEGLLFEDFTVLDSANNPLRVDGRMYTDNYQSYRFDMNVHADRLTVLNTTKESEELYFGKVIIDADLHLTGTELEPKVKMEATIKEGTELSARILDSNPAVTEREGLIEFVDFSADTSSILTRKKRKDTIKTSITELDVTAVLNMDEKMLFKVYIDEAAGDYLSLQGGGQMGLGIDPAGNLTLTGRYTVSSGMYQLSFYKLVTRRFDIQEGGYIQWFGDPFNAVMDLTASYEKTVAVNNLFPGSVSADTETQENQYAQRVPVRVNINITEQLLAPEIDFDIVLPEEEKGAYNGAIDSKLQELNQNESDVNKQAFGLLVLGNFIPEEQAAAGASAQSATRSSVSGMLSSQLNSLSNKYIKIVDLSVGLDSYEGTQGATTELELGLSKQFLNNRMEVSVSTNTNLEGEESSNTAFVGDVSVQYKLTEDGAYKIKGYQQNEYDGLIEGVLVETGVAFIFVRDFDHTRELLIRRKKAEQSEEEEEEEDKSDDVPNNTEAPPSEGTTPASEPQKTPSTPKK